MNEIVRVETENALESMERAQVDMQIATAKKYPRSIAKARQKVLELATCDPKVAESCFYMKPQDGKVIEGPSIRLAEIVAASYGNMKCAARIIQETKDSIVCQGVCIDLENNVSSSVEVRKSIVKSNGSRYSPTMVVTTMNAGCAVAFRNAVFKTVPSAIFKDVFADIKKVSVGDERTINERRKAAVAWFKGKGVKEKQVYEMLSNTTDTPAKGLSDITIDHLHVLNGIKTAITDGDTTLSEAFSSLESNKTKGAKIIADKIKAKRKTSKAEEKAAETSCRAELDTLYAKHPEVVEDSLESVGLPKFADLDETASEDMLKQAIVNVKEII